MHYKVFGRKTGLRVSELALGAANFGTGWGHGAERDEAKRIFDGYVEAGGNFIDTANGYQGGQSEAMLSEFIAAERHRLVIATKYTLGTTPAAGISHTGNSRKNMIRAVEESLTRLKTDHIDLFWAHMSDGVTPMEEILRGFDDLVRAGKIHYAGLSNFPAWRIARADLLAEVRGFAPIAAIQVEYSLAERPADACTVGQRVGGVLEGVGTDQHVAVGNRLGRGRRECKAGEGDARYRAHCNELLDLHCGAILSRGFTEHPRARALRLVEAELLGAVSDAGKSVGIRVACV